MPRADLEMAKLIYLAIVSQDGYVEDNRPMRATDTGTPYTPPYTPRARGGTVPRSG